MTFDEAKNLPAGTILTLEMAPYLHVIITKATPTVHRYRTSVCGVFVECWRMSLNLETQAFDFESNGEVELDEADYEIVHTPSAKREALQAKAKR